jgi:hypothetical protein
MIYTATCFDILLSSSGSLNVRLAKLNKFFKLQLLKIQFRKIKMFHIKLKNFLEYGCWNYKFIKAEITSL